MPTHGRVIAILGAPASGKSTLLRNLEEQFVVRAFYEGEENDLPEFIKENLKQQTRMLETMLWFHIRGFQQMKRAKKAAANGETVILDTCWLSNWFFIPAALERKEEQKLFGELLKMLQHTHMLPDLFCYLQAPTTLLAERMERRGRQFEEGLLSYVEQVNRRHEECLQKTGGLFCQKPLLTLPAERIDVQIVGKALGFEPK